MVAYVVGELIITDNSWVEDYRPKVHELIEKHGGKFIAQGGVLEKLEGPRALPNGVVIIEFPTSEQARAWYHDPAYAPWIKLRDTGSRCEITLVEGLE